MTVTVGRDEVQNVLRTVQALAEKRVLIGVPSETAERDSDGKAEPINNAGILYVMEHGEPEHNVPARPTLIPGVKAVMPRTMRILKNAAAKALEGDKGAADRALEAAGLVAEASVKNMISSNVPPPLAPSTIRNRKYARGTKSRRATETAYLEKVKGGMDHGQAQTETGIIALVNTGELRNSITHVIRNAK